MISDHDQREKTQDTHYMIAKTHVMYQLARHGYPYTRLVPSRIVIFVKISVSLFKAKIFSKLPVFK